MKFSRTAALAILALTATNARAQGSVSGTVFDSLSSHRELANATVVLVERNKYATTDARGHFVFDSVPDGHYTIGVMHAILDSLDVQLPTTPVEVVGNRPTTVQIFTPSRKTLALTVARRSAAASRAAAKESAVNDSTQPLSRGAQALRAVKIEENATPLTLMERDGFEKRRTMGLGAFLTEEDIAKHGYSDLASVLNGTRGVRVDFTGNGKSAGIAFPMPRMLGVASAGRAYCTPNFFLDGAPMQARTPATFRELSGMAVPSVIKGIEVYSNPGTVPAQYDLFSSTGCGSVVIWTR